MSNTSDPKPTPPDQPDPTKAGAKPDGAKPGEREHTGGSSYEFQLPADGSYSDLPPVPQQAANDASAAHAALPPRPTTTRPSSGSFDFIDLGDIDPAMLPGSGLHHLPPVPPAPVRAPAEPMLLTPTDDALALPPLAATGNSSVTFSLPVPTAGPSSFTLGGEVLDLADFPADPASGVASVPDIGSLYPTADPPSSFILGESIPAVPAAPDSSGSFVFPLPEVPTADPASFAGRPALADLDLPMADPGSFVMGDALPPTGTPTPDLESELGMTDPNDAIAPASGWLHPYTPKPPADANRAAAVPPAASPPAPTGRSSYEFTLPDGMKTYSDMPPVAAPDPEDPSAAHAAPVPPPPVTGRHADVSFDFEFGELLEGVPLSDPELKAKVAAPGAPLLTPTDGVIHLPPARDPAAAAGNLEPVDPVAPASGWLDADVLSIPVGGAPPLVPTAEPVSGASDPIPADSPDSSDIFSGSRTAPALPVEYSDVIAATAYGTATPPDAGRPVEPHRPSDVALSFDGPPGGSTVHDGGSDDLPLADEFDSGTLTIAPSDAPSSIHDLPDPGAADSLFDSARLADTPDLPPGAALDDAADYGTGPAYSADASSILGDLSDPELTGADSSSVRVEAPGVGRTLTGGRAEDAFELTVSDDPVPADLFDVPSEGTAADATDWQSQSGSDLFAEPRTAHEIDLDAERAGTVEPVDPDLTGDQSSLTSAPSSIFSGSRPVTGSAGSADVRIGTPDPADELAEAEPFDADAAEFTDHPTLAGTAERETDRTQATPSKAARRASSGDFELPPVAPAADDGGVIDWDAAALADGADATRGIPKDASLSAIMRGLADDSSETPTRTSQPVARIGDDDDGTPMVTVDWMAASGEGSAVSEAQAEAAKTAPTKPKDKDRKAKEEAGDRGKKKPARVADAGTDEAQKRKPSRPAPAERADADDSGEWENRKPAKKGGGLVVGLLLGAVVAGGASAGAYFGGLVPNGEKTAEVKPKPNGGTDPNAPTGPGTPPPPVAAVASARDAFAAGDTARALQALKDKPPATTEERAAAGYVRLFAKVQELGKATAAADDADLAAARADLKAVIADADAAKTAEGEKRAVAASVRLGVSYEVAGNAAEARKVFADAKAQFPKHAAVFEALIDRLDADKAGPGASFRAPRFTPEEAQRVLFAVSVLLIDDAPTTDDPEPGVAYWKAIKFSREGKYKEAIDAIREAKEAHVKRAKALAGRGLNPLTDPLEQMFPRSCDQLAAYWTLQKELYANPATAEAMKANVLAKRLDALVKAEEDWLIAKVEAAKLKTELKDAKAEVAKSDAAAKKAAADKLSAETALDKAAADLKAKQKEKDDLLAALAAELKPAKVLPEKWTPADLIAGVKVAAGLASGADAQRVVKAEAAAKAAEVAAKAAAEKLAADTKKLNEKYDTDTARLKADNVADLKALKDGNAEDVKKLTDKFAADAKKVTDDHLAAVKKLKDASDAAVKEEQAKTDAERRAAALKEIAFQKQLANAVTPAQAVDIWLPVLTDLRRASDADPAMAVAARALTSAVPDSEDAAKAHTVNGMALLLKGDFAAAKDAFQAARRNPAYVAAKGKAWAKAADAGLEAIDDPLAPYRRPVVTPPTDPRAAAKSLDAGIVAYKAGKYDTAAAALLDAAKNDPADPVAWYYLGAVRLALGDAKQAEKDIGQGAEREKASPLPARTVSAALAPIQGAVRDAIDRARP